MKTLLQYFQYDRIFIKNLKFCSPSEADVSQSTLRYNVAQLQIRIETNQW